MLDFFDWEEDGHIGAVGYRVGTAFDVNLSAMTLDELFCYKQPYSSPDRASRRKERLKNSWQLLSRDTHPVIRY